MPDEISQRFLSVSQWVAATFEERGTTVPFTTPLLSSARVRPEERHGLVLLTPRFAETASVYVLPWASLPTVVTLSLHDRALHKAIMSARAINPVAMRQQALHIAAMGLSGPEVQNSANQAMVEDRKYSEEVHCILILCLLRDLHLDISNIAGLRLDQSGALAHIKTELTQAIKPLGIQAGTLYDRVGRLATILAPLGLATFGRQGRLRDLLSELIKFHHLMKSRCNDSGTEVQTYYHFAADVAGQNIDIAESIVQHLDTTLVNLPELIRGWDKLLPDVERLADRAAWLLDGWDYALGFARGMDDWRLEEQLANFENLALMLPIVPRHESAENTPDNPYEKQVQRRRVHALEDWRSGRMDLELKHRLEAAKARALAPPPAPEASKAADVEEPEEGADEPLKEEDLALKETAA